MLHRLALGAGQHDPACFLVPLIGAHPLVDRFVDDAASGTWIRIRDLSI